MCGCREREAEKDADQALLTKHLEVMRDHLELAMELHGIITNVHVQFDSVLPLSMLVKK